MRHAVCWVLFASIGLMAIGCGGDKKLRTQGRLLKGGQPLVLKPDQKVRITFVPILPDGKPPADHYTALYDSEKGTFVAAGKDRNGMPPGKYRVAVELATKKKDDLKGMYDEDRSPFVFDIDSSTKEIEIDLDKPPSKS